jgi:hypothetical protein
VNSVIAFFARDERVFHANRDLFAKKAVGRVARGNLTPGLPQNRA